MITSYDYARIIEITNLKSYNHNFQDLINRTLIYLLFIKNKKSLQIRYINAFKIKWPIFTRMSVSPELKI